MIKLTLPYPPALNNLYFSGRTKDGRMFRVLSTAGKQYKSNAWKMCRESGAQMIIGDVGIIFRAYRPRRIGDLDGLFKVVFDSLKGAAYIDDKQICEIIANRYEDPQNPRVEIEIRALSLL